MDFPTCLSHEADSQQEARDSGDFALGRAHIPEVSGRKVYVCELGEGFARLRASDVDRAVGGGYVNHVGTVGGTSVPPVEPLFDDIRVA